MLKVLGTVLVVVVAAVLLLLGLSAFFTIGWNMFVPALNLPSIDIFEGVGAIIVLLVIRSIFAGLPRTTPTVVTDSVRAPVRTARKTI